MHISLVFRVLGILMMLFSLSMIPPMIVSALYEDGQMQYFLHALALILGTGFIVWFPTRHIRHELRVKTGSLSPSCSGSRSVSVGPSHSI